jgi:hypothetical protein
MAKERWRIVPSEPHYEVSDFGRVRSIDFKVTCIGRGGKLYTRSHRGRMLKPVAQPGTGYFDITVESDRYINGGHAYEPKGELHHNAKLTDDQVRQIRKVYRRYGKAHILLAKKFGISGANAALIGKRKAWPHVV